MDKIGLGSISDITPFRERLREAVKNMKTEVPVVLFVSPGDDEAVARAMIEETGLEYCGQFGARGEFEFVRPARAERWEYAFRHAGISEIPREWKCLDVGCGRNPWPRANSICDSNDDMRAYERELQTFSVGSVTERLPYRDKEFDFATCFHVLEHVSDPIAAARELTRVAKSGLIECPHPVKEGIMLFLETDHRWFVLPPALKDGPVRFVRMDLEWAKHMHDAEAQGAAYRTFIANTDKTGDRAILRNYFARVEPDLNVIHRWYGELKVEVLG